MKLKLAPPRICSHRELESASIALMKHHPKLAMRLFIAVNWLEINWLPYHPQRTEWN